MPVMGRYNVFITTNFKVILLFMCKVRGIWSVQSLVWKARKVKQQKLGIEMGV